MDIKLAKEIIDCLPQGKTGFRYYKDRYAAFVLSQQIGDNCALSKLKKTRYAGLLNKPLIKQLLAQSGNGKLSRDQLELSWQEPSEAFLLSLATWGGKNRRWDQVSRSGCNLVLQLNFSNQHDHFFRKLIAPEDEHDFRYSGHPVMFPGQRELFRETMAWARIDIDFQHNEALIEELQTDWLRIARRRFQLMEKQQSKIKKQSKNGRLFNYVKTLLKSYDKIWNEAMLTATMQFIVDELGITKIYLHTPDSGAAIKKIRYRQPPRSLYTKLPRQFCFTKTDQAPEFLIGDREFRKLEKKLGGSEWNLFSVEKVI